MHSVFLGIGGNLGNKQTNFKKVYRLIESELGTITTASSIYETPPWGFSADENFWNQVIVVETQKSAKNVLLKIHEIEDAFWRKRKKGKYTSRKMDIDILYFDDILLETETLIIPHPRICQRKFVLVPLTEIAPGFKHPLLHLTNSELLKNCKDESTIKKVEN